jgi:hypothetical protein
LRTLSEFDFTFNHLLGMLVTASEQGEQGRVNLAPIETGRHEKVTLIAVNDGKWRTKEAKERRMQSLREIWQIFDKMVLMTISPKREKCESQRWPGDRGDR